MSTRRSGRRSSNTARDFPRTARVAELLREIIAEELERVDDDRLDVVTVISIDVEADLRRATVFYDCLDGEAGDEDAMAALGEARWLLQRAIGRQARIKRVPELTFAPDPSVRSGERIDALLRDVEDDPEVGPSDTAEPAEPVDAADPTAPGPTAAPDAGGTDEP